MSYKLSPITGKDQIAVIDIFNYYVENGFAAFPDHIMPYEAFQVYMQHAEDFPTLSAKDANGNLAGFAMLRPHNPQSAFISTAEITYFVHPDHTGKGLGSQMLDRLIKQARKQLIVCILASISSLNEGSIRFHQKHGFTKCGHFIKAAQKNGQFFDVIWMQKLLD
jgi:phosphinothricin acetyltransferase